MPRRGDSLGRSVTGAFGGQSVKEVDEEEEVEEADGGRKRPGSARGKMKEDDDEDWIDARNAASRLAASTF